MACLQMTWYCQLMLLYYITGMTDYILLHFYIVTELHWEKKNQIATVTEGS